MLICIAAGGCVKPESEKEQEDTMSVGEIKSFERISITESGVRYKCEYELTASDSQAEMAEYSITFADGGERRELKRSASCGMEETLEALNVCGIGSWNGFIGAHPEGVDDGMMFSFEAVVNDSNIIRAKGSENFPDHYRELIAWITGKLSEGT